MLQSSLTKVNTKRAYRSPLRYPGGKQKALSQIASVLPKRAYEYREPLVGGGSVFFHARSVDFAEKYWINDEFGDLISFWKTVQSPELCARLQEDLERLRVSFRSPQQTKKFFQNAREECADDPYRVALLFFFFNRVTFSGTTRAGGFSVQASQHRFTRSSIERLATMPDALAFTKVTHGDFERVISHPGKDVFIFLDPPYFTAKKLYGRNGNLHEFDHQRLADVLQNSKHKFLITYDDCKQIRDLYKWADIRKWRLQYGMNNCNAQNLSKVGAELFISNY